MSEQEFELYLSLLSKLLKLDKNQRAEISDEMRDHLEARFNDLVKKGCDRKEAIELALDEFGDANVLAGEFSQLATRQRRRKIMRLTFGTIVSSACLIFVIQAMWPESHLPQQNRFVTSNSHAEEEPAKEIKPEETASKSNVSRTTKDSPLDENSWIYTSYSTREKEMAMALELEIRLEFEDATLLEIIEYIKDLKKIPIIVKKYHLEDQGVNMEVGNITFIQDKCRLRSALNIILEPLQLTYRIQNEVLVIDTVSSDAELGHITRVYNCRDLLAVPQVEVQKDGTYYDPAKAKKIQGNFLGGGGGFGGGGGGGFSVQDQITSQLNQATLNQVGAGIGNSSKQPKPVIQYVPIAGAAKLYSPAQIREMILIDVIRNSTNQDNWADTSSTINPYHGMLIITAPENLHRQVVELLEMLRESFRGENLLNEELSRRNKGYEILEQNK